MTNVLSSFLELMTILGG